MLEIFMHAYKRNTEMNEELSFVFCLIALLKK